MNWHYKYMYLGSYFFFSCESFKLVELVPEIKIRFLINIWKLKIRQRRKYKCLYRDCFLVLKLGSILMKSKHRI